MKIAHYKVLGENEEWSFKQVEYADGSEGVPRWYRKTTASLSPTYWPEMFIFIAAFFLSLFLAIYVFRRAREKRDKWKIGKSMWE